MMAITPTTGKAGIVGAFVFIAEPTKMLKELGV